MQPTRRRSMQTTTQQQCTTASKIGKVDKAKAVELKQQGLTYKQIAEALGCSEVWCKKNLKAVVKDKQKTDMIEKYITKSCSKQGITSGAITYMLEQDMYSELKDLPETKKQEQLQKQARIVKRKVREAGGIVRPHWMHPMYSKECLALMLEFVDDFDRYLSDRLHEFLQDMKDLTGEQPRNMDASVLSTVSMISQLGMQTYGASGTVSICNKLSETADELYKKNYVGDVVSETEQFGFGPPKPVWVQCNEDEVQKLKEHQASQTRLRLDCFEDLGQFVI